MNVMKTISEIGLLRRFGLPLMRLTNFNITINHPWVSDFRITLNSFLHKGYWFHGSRRERDSMQLFATLIAPGSVVVEVGGHIGYITAHFASIASATGEVIVFEPGSNNLPYIRRNITRMSKHRSLAKVTLIEKAVGPAAGRVEFFEDNLTGQNNSIVENFPGLKANTAWAFIKTQVDMRTVEMISLDEFLAGSTADFIKIDVEGFELGVLKGMTDTLLTQRPAIMVEVQASEEEIFSLLRSNGYELFSAKLVPLASAAQLSGNVFCLHHEKHKEQLDRLFQRAP